MELAAGRAVGAGGQRRDQLEAVQQAQTYSTTFGNFSGYMIAAVLFVYITIPLARYTDGLIARRNKLEQAQG